MAKIALLIGVSEYAEGFLPLHAVHGDVEEMRKVLQNPDMGGFDEVKPLIDPNRQTMADEIEKLFSNRQKNDLVLLYFSGHGVKDENDELYLASNITSASNGKLSRSTAIEASFIQKQMQASLAKRQVIILDCCFSGAFAGGLCAKSVVENISKVIKAQLGSVGSEEEIITQSNFETVGSRTDSDKTKARLGAEGRAVLTSSTSTQYSYEPKKLDGQESSNLSIYTRYLVEGIKTGAADLDNDRVISIGELHEYARQKVQEAAPAMNPEIYPIKEGYKIVLAKAPIDDPKLDYRRTVERVAILGEISTTGRYTLDALKEKLRLPSHLAEEIETEVLEPYQERKKNIKKYETAFSDAIQVGNLINDYTRNELKLLQQILNLRDEDIVLIEEQISRQPKQNIYFPHRNEEQSNNSSFPTVEFLMRALLIGIEVGLLVIAFKSLSKSGWIEVSLYVLIPLGLAFTKNRQVFQLTNLSAITLFTLLIVLVVPNFRSISTNPSESIDSLTVILIATLIGALFTLVSALALLIFRLLSQRF